ncbi:MAG: HAD-IA family hydrolase [Myxococcota bacterium]|nr:HAD-IA family hydrolase [Myxococcota bacterium]
MSLNPRSSDLPNLWCGLQSSAVAFRSISFDLDGTFADTSGDLAGALNALRVELGQATLPVPDVARFVGRGARWLVSNCLEPAGDVEPLVLRFLELYAGCCSDTTAPYEGFDHLVSALRKRGLKVAIATNKPRRFTELIVDDLGWDSLFDGLHCGDDGPAKPDPSMIHACIKALQSSPEQHLHIGDTATDAQAAARAGCLFAGCFWGMDKGLSLTEMGLTGFAQPSDLIAAFRG